MKKCLFSLLAIMMATTVCVCFASCSKGDEPDIVIPDDDNPGNNGGNDDDPKYAIVGKWEVVSGSLTYYDYTKTLIQYIVLDIKKDGTFSYINSGNYNVNGELIPKDGTWEYDSTTHKWNLSSKSNVISGEYSLSGGQLTCYVHYGDNESRTIIYEKYNEQASVGSIIGSWKYMFDDNNFCMLTFDNEEGVLYQEYDEGEWNEDYFIYKYKNGILTIYDINDDAEAGDVRETIKVSVLTTKKMLLKDWPDEGMNIFVRQ